MSSYQELQRQYPNKEIKLILKKYEEQYKNFGFKTISEGMQKSVVDNKYNVDYVFMIEQ